MCTNYEGFKMLLGNVLIVVLFGLLLSLAVVGVVYFALRAVYSSYYPSPLGFAVFLVLFLFIFFEGIFLTGAVRVKKYIREVNDFIETTYVANNDSVIEGDRFGDTIKELEDNYPLLESYMSYIDGDNEDGDLISSLHYARQWLGRYIIKRLSAMAIASVICGLLAGVFRRKTRRMREDTDYEMYEG